MSGFMQQQITDKQSWIEIDGSHGIEVYPAEYFTKDQARAEYPGAVSGIETILGYGARLSAPGYLDCTEWTVFPSIAAAQEWLDEFYGDDDEDDKDQPMPRRCFMAIRRATDDGHEWVDYRTASDTDWLCRDHAENANHKIPGWSDANPVIRYQRFTLAEED